MDSLSNNGNETLKIMTAAEDPFPITRLSYNFAHTSLENHAQIQTCVEETILVDDRCGRLWIVLVAAHHLRTPDQDFAGLSQWHLEEKKRTTSEGRVMPELSLI